MAEDIKRITQFQRQVAKGLPPGRKREALLHGADIIDSQVKIWEASGELMPSTRTSLQVSDRLSLQSPVEFSPEYEELLHRADIIYTFGQGFLQKLGQNGHLKAEAKTRSEKDSAVLEIVQGEFFGWFLDLLPQEIRPGMVQRLIQNNPLFAADYKRFTGEEVELALSGIPLTISSQSVQEYMNTIQEEVGEKRFENGRKQSHGVAATDVREICNFYLTHPEVALPNPLKIYLMDVRKLHTIEDKRFANSFVYLPPAEEYDGILLDTNPIHRVIKPGRRILHRTISAPTVDFCMSADVSDYNLGGKFTLTGRNVFNTDVQSSIIRIKCDNFADFGKSTEADISCRNGAYLYNGQLYRGRIAAPLLEKSPGYIIYDDVKVVTDNP